MKIILIIIIYYLQRDRKYLMREYRGIGITTAAVPVPQKPFP